MTPSKPSLMSRLFGAVEAPSTHEIPRGAICRIVRPSGWHVACLAGSVWVTQDRDPRDIMLEAGEHCRITGGARVLVQALEPARVLLS